MTLQHQHRQRARIYDALNRHKDYAQASARLRQWLNEVVPHATTVLDVACGTGLHLLHLRNHYYVEGLDLSRQMLEAAQARCPDVVLHEASLTEFQLNRKFDVVSCLFGSIGYAVTTTNLQNALRCMAAHLRPGGAVVVEPWISPDRFFCDKIVFDSVNESDLKVARMYVTRREGDAAVYDSQYLVATQDGLSHFAEREVLGLFTDDAYRAAFRSAGLDIIESDLDLFGYGSYTAISR